jgi:hypothetical protein
MRHLSGGCLCGKAGHTVDADPIDVCGAADAEPMPASSRPARSMTRAGLRQRSKSVAVKLGLGRAP